ncbi:MAG: ThuA domain-containing protein [bacterium]
MRQPARRLVLLGGGTWHDFPMAARVLGEAFSPYTRVEYTEDAGSLAHGALQGADALALYTCLAAEDPGLAHKAHAEFPAAAARAVESFVAQGGAFLGLHSTLCSFMGWTGLGEIMGGRWVWGETGHDPVAPFAVRVRTGHPIVTDLGPFEVNDEHYFKLKMLRDVDVLLESDWRGAVQPQGWATTYGKGRVFVSVLGHTAEALGHPAHRRFLTAGLAWALP